MAELIYVVQRPGEGASILSAYRQLANGVAFDRLTAMFAFASFKGARLLTTAISESLPNWRRTRKRWVISVDGGITEPEALRFLLRLQRSEVRVPDGHEMLRRGLRPVNRFHPKTILLEAAEGAFRPVAIAVGSANLTCSGLCFGHEHTLLAGLDHLDGVPAGIAAGLESLHTMLESTPTIDEDFVDRYAAIRPARPSLPEEDRRSEHILQDRSAIAAVEAAALARASGLWVQVDYVVPNRGPNEEGNQIDLKRGTRVFFGFGDGALRGTPQSGRFASDMGPTQRFETSVLETTKWTSSTSPCQIKRNLPRTEIRHCCSRESPTARSVSVLVPRRKPPLGNTHRRESGPCSVCRAAVSTACSEIPCRC